MPIGAGTVQHKDSPLEPNPPPSPAPTEPLPRPVPAPASAELHATTVDLMPLALPAARTPSPLTPQAPATEADTPEPLPLDEDASLTPTSPIPLGDDSSALPLPLLEDASPVSASPMPLGGENASTWTMFADAAPASGRSVDHAQPTALPGEPGPPGGPSIASSPASASLLTPASTADESIRIFSGPAIRRAIESVLIFLCVVIFLRTMAVEPFGVPTGSMAGTLTGNHKACDCPRCGYHVIVGDPGTGSDSRLSAQAYANASCPNCGMRPLPLESQPEIQGDRLLVDKNVFQLRSPHRWEMVVFRCPVDLSKPYVKRVVGLPGERIAIQEGDIYINGTLARKSWRDCVEMRVPIWDQNFVPPMGWADRWVPLASNKKLATAEPHPLRGSELHLHADTQAYWITYRNWLLDERKEEILRDQLGYNSDPRKRVALNPVHDFLVEFDLVPQEGNGVFCCQLTDGQDTVTVEVPIGSVGEARLILEKGSTPRVVSGVKLEMGRPSRLGMAFVDRRVMCLLDGKELFPAYDLPAVPPRAEVSRPMQLGLRNASVIVRNVRLFRDIYYTSSGHNAVQGEYPLGPNEYFVLGDNSANSDDSRWWRIAGVPEEAFIGKPFLLHQPSKRGRWKLFPGQREPLAIDWERIRWLR